MVKTRPNLAIIKPVETDLGNLGPAMEALSTDRQRNFVIRFVENGGKQARLMRSYLEAGYTPSDPHSTTANSNAWRLVHDQRIQAAIREESLNRLGAAALAASSYLVELLESDDPTIKPSTKMKAASMIMNRVGLHETTEHKVTVEKKMTEKEKVDAIISAAERLGLDPVLLLGRAGYDMAKEEPKIVEAEVIGTTAGLEDLLG